MAETVLVTGGTGFIAGWCVVELLRRGYRVRTTVRSAAKGEWLRGQIATQIDAEDRLAFAVADLMDDAGWDEAVAGCDYVLHVAAPVGVETPDDPDEIIRPTREGALRVLAAARRAGVKRVVLTSAIEAARQPLSRREAMSDETRWTDAKDKTLGAYRLAKTLGEKAAWDFMAQNPGPTTLTTILPSAVFGPVFSRDYAHAFQIFGRLLTGKMPGLPRFGFCVVDVRDVADIHIRAMTASGAAGQRFIAAGEFLWIGDLARMLRKTLGPAADKVPTRELPNVMVRLVSLFDRQARFVVPLLGRRHVFSSEKAKRMLGWTPRPVEETVVDTAKSAIAVGAV